ncbi:unnamed protein product [Auanema sp. JU1783]|nr:unnamed protein product [Auanema sp. JU1783]
MGDIFNFTTAPSVRLIIKAGELKNRDLFSKSDPLCVVYKLKHSLDTGESWVEIGRTEMIRNCLNPEWSEEIELEYMFEEKQNLRFDIYDIDCEKKPLSQQDFLGRMECDLAEIVSIEVFQKSLSGLKKNSGFIMVRSVEVQQGAREILEFFVKGENLDKKDLFGKSDPYLEVYRFNKDGTKSLVHRTEYVRKTLNPTWRPFRLDMQALCFGDKTRNVSIVCWDNNDGKSAKPDLIGEYVTSVNHLLEPSTRIKLVNGKKKEKKGKKYEHSGILLFNIKCHMEYSFLNYINGGTQLDFAVAIDFTASNGNVEEPSSLHFIGINVPNQYETAIRAVLEICQFYNNSRIFDAFGFGAIVPPRLENTELFDVKNPKATVIDPAVVGVDGVMDAYRGCLRKVHLFGPTNFAPIIQGITERFQEKLNIPGSRYQILLIITDGAISDLENTKREIIKASKLPLSIIIIGVGQADFEAMDELDGDDNLINIDGVYAQRDIVQFVPMKKFLKNGLLQNHRHVMATLAKEVLAEVPTQLSSYMKSKRIAPRPVNDPFPKDAPAVETRRNKNQHYYESTKQSSLYAINTRRIPTAPPLE